jgi:transposase
MPSPVEYLAQAIGKYRLYLSILNYLKINHPLYMAVPEAAYRGILSEAIGQQTLMTEAVIQYDMASVYFEGEYADSELARSSYSRDNRIQALVLLTMIALVVYSVLEWRCASAHWGASVEASKKIHIDQIPVSCCALALIFTCSTVRRRVP